MNILVLLTDGFAVPGGIAKFNTNLLNALCAYPGVAEVTALPRRIADAAAMLPSRPTN